MRKMQPVKFTEEERQEIQSQLNVQTESVSAPKSWDPVNFPVFEVPINKKVLIYVPNHIVQDEDGVDRLRMDKPLLHSITVGKRYIKYRCIRDIVNTAKGFDGECPLCDGTSEPWDLANIIIKQKCEAQGLDPEDTENKSVKSIRSDAFGDRALKDSARYYTFPIVVFETLNDDGKTTVQDEQGNIKYQIMWYSISERMWAKTWAKTLEGMEDEPTHPGGRFFLLNYTYETKNGAAPNKRDSAQNLAVNHRVMKNSDKLKEFLDKATEEWTPIKAQETVIDNTIYSPTDLEEATNEALEGTRNLLAVYNAKGITGDSATAALPENTGGDGFNLEKKESSQPEEGTPVGETDLDAEADA